MERQNEANKKYKKSALEKLKEDPVKISQKWPNIWATFIIKICRHDHSKIAKSGRTEYYDLGFLPKEAEMEAFRSKMTVNFATSTVVK